jgi:Zn-dependent peptidase ImmA (M78 family)
LQRKLTKIESEWNKIKIEKGILTAIKKNKPECENSYICHLGRYGSLEFYEVPNKLIIRIANRQDLLESNINITHELVHLILHKNKKDLNLEFIDKEKMVDDFLVQREFKKILPEYKKQKFQKVL